MASTYDELNMDKSEIMFRELTRSIVNIYKVCLEEMGYDLCTTENEVEYHNYLINNPITINGGGYYGAGAMISGGQVTNPLELNIKEDENTYHLVLWRYAEFKTALTGRVSQRGRSNENTIEGVIYEYKTNNVLAYTIEDSADTRGNHFYNDTDTYLIPGGNSWPNESEIHRGQSAYCAKLAGGRGGFGNAMGRPGTMLAVQCAPGCLLHYGKDVGYSLGCILIGEKSVNGSRPNFTKEEWLPSNIFTTTAPNASFWKNLYDHVVPAICSGKKVALHIRKRIGTMNSTGATMGSNGPAGTPPQGLVSLTQVFTAAGYKANEDYIIRPIYATANNFVGKVINGYRAGQTDLWATESTANRLAKAIPLFKNQGWIMCIYDAYRPARASKEMYNWGLQNLGDNSGLIAQNSRHNLGNAVDLTVVDIHTKQYIQMVPNIVQPHAKANGGFDDFDRKSRDTRCKFNKGNSNQVKLRNIMEKAVGLGGINSEWWHFQTNGGSSHDVPY